MRGLLGQSQRDVQVTNQQELILRSGAVVAIVCLSIVVIDMLNDWLGDWLSLMWVSACLAVPYGVGFAMGKASQHRVSTIFGGVLGLVITGLPLMLYLPDGIQGSSTTLSWCFVILGILQGALMLPAGGRVRNRVRNT